jgi:hypothetical protein
MNKKIKALLTIGVLALVALTSSCQSDNKAPKGDQTAETYQEPGAFTIRFSVPSGDPVKYDLRGIQDEREYTIDNVTLLIYEANKLALDPIAISSSELKGTNDPTKKVYSSTNNQIPKGNVTIYAIANEDNAALTALQKGSELSQLQAIIAKGEQKANESSSLVVNGDGKAGSSDKIPMVGVREGVKLSGQDVTIDLERIVARIDIKNNVDNGQLEITEVTLENANSKSLLVNDFIANVPGVSQKVSGVKPFLFTPGADRMEHNKVFYLYEGNQAGTTAKEATRVVIKAKFKGESKVYDIPFFDRKSNKGINIVRNTLYRISLGTDRTGYNLNFSIEVADWNGHPETVVTWDLISVSYDEANNASGFSYNSALHELTAPKTAASAYFTPAYGLDYASSKFTATVGASAASWLTASVESDGRVKVNVQDAGTVAREGYVTITCDANPQHKYLILVKQDKQ